MRIEKLPVRAGLDTASTTPLEPCCTKVNPPARFTVSPIPDGGLIAPDSNPLIQATDGVGAQPPPPPPPDVVIVVEVVTPLIVWAGGLPALPLRCHQMPSSVAASAA